MTTVMDDKQTYLTDFERFEREAPVALTELRRTALANFDALGFPSTDNEEWRVTPLTSLVRVPFQLAAPDPDVRPELPEGARLVFVNGRFASHLSVLPALPPGAFVGSLAEALQTRRELVEPHLGRYAKFDDHAFVALNTAFVHDGVFIHLPSGKVLEEPLHLVFASTASGDPTVSHPRNLIVAGTNSQMTLVECYVGPTDAVYLTNAVTEVVLADGAVIDHYKLQQESREAFHLATMQVQQARGSNFRSHAVTLGSSLTRNDINAYLGGEGCECTLNGLYLASGEQLIDNHTRIDHAMPRCNSHELYKGILDGKARGVFNGKIYVHPDAQKTDAKQTNQTLLLSDDAVINTKPQLEIYADDVKCTHGATVGQLDAAQLFYLRSRGIGTAAARSLLTFAFANDVVDRLRVKSLRRRLAALLLASQHLPEDFEIGEEP